MNEQGSSKPKLFFHASQEELYDKSFRKVEGDGCLEGLPALPDPLLYDSYAEYQEAAEQWYSGISELVYESHVLPLPTSINYRRITTSTPVLLKKKSQINNFDSQNSLLSGANLLEFGRSLITPGKEINNDMVFGKLEYDKYEIKYSDHFKEEKTDLVMVEPMPQLYDTYDEYEKSFENWFENRNQKIENNVIVNPDVEDVFNLWSTNYEEPNNKKATNYNQKMDFEVVKNVVPLDLSKYENLIFDEEKFNVDIFNNLNSSKKLYSDFYDIDHVVLELVNYGSSSKIANMRLPKLAIKKVNNYNKSFPQFMFRDETINLFQEFEKKEKINFVKLIPIKKIKWFISLYKPKIIVVAQRFIYVIEKLLDHDKKYKYLEEIISDINTLQSLLIIYEDAGYIMTKPIFYRLDFSDPNYPLHECLVELVKLGMLYSLRITLNAQYISNKFRITNKLSFMENKQASKVANLFLNEKNNIISVYLSENTGQNILTPDIDINRLIMQKALKEQNNIFTEYDTKQHTQKVIDEPPKIKRSMTIRQPRYKITKQIDIQSFNFMEESDESSFKLSDPLMLSNDISSNDLECIYSLDSKFLTNDSTDELKLSYLHPASSHESIAYRLILLSILLPNTQVHYSLFSPSPIDFFNKLSPYYNTNTEKLKIAFYYSDAFSNTFSILLDFSTKQLFINNIEFSLKLIDTIIKLDSKLIKPDQILRLIKTYTFLTPEISYSLLPKISLLYRNQFKNSNIEELQFLKENYALIVPYISNLIQNSSNITKRYLFSALEILVTSSKIKMTNCFWDEFFSSLSNAEQGSWHFLKTISKNNAYLVLCNDFETRFCSVFYQENSFLFFNIIKYFALVVCNAKNKFLAIFEKSLSLMPELKEFILNYEFDDKTKSVQIIHYYNLISQIAESKGFKLFSSFFVK